MNVYGYINTPTGNNDFHAQHFAILSFASNNRLDQVHFIHESAPDRLHGAKPILSGMLDNLHRGDTMLTTDFQKLGDTTVAVLDALSILSRRGVRLYVVNSGYRLDSNADALVVNMACSLLEMIEKDVLVHPEQEPVPIQMQHEDADIQTPTRRIRRSRLDDRRSEIELLLSTGISLSEAARRLGVSRPALTDWVESRNPSVHNPPATT